MLHFFISLTVELAYTWRTQTKVNVSRVCVEQLRIHAMILQDKIHFQVLTKGISYCTVVN